MFLCLDNNVEFRASTITDLGSTKFYSKRQFQIYDASNGGSTGSRRWMSSGDVFLRLACILPVTSYHNGAEFVGSLSQQIFMYFGFQNLKRIGRV